ncbi:hypothetical protein JHK86_052288 [Glycine max]|nr:hypothetical protein JHK86_052288 [Glycine max]
MVASPQVLDQSKRRIHQVVHTTRLRTSQQSRSKWFGKQNWKLILDSHKDIFDERTEMKNSRSGIQPLDVLTFSERVYNLA